MSQISYRFLVPERSAKPQVSAHDRIMGTHRLLIATAEADGQLRLADNHRQVHDNLNRLIAALEDIADTTP